MTATQQLTELLNRLSKDDEFREKMLGDPIAALAEFGFKANQSEIPFARRLPSKYDLVAERDKIESRISDHVCLLFFLQTT